MPKFKLRDDHPAVDLYKPASRGMGSFRVEPGQEIEVPGDLVTSRPEPKKGEEALPSLPEDAYIVANRGEEKAWPHAVWELVTEKPAVKAPAVKEN
ncbi:hypothetical protein [Amycolatopsis thermoflava]|uniref:hypothetical protein n=1 Tax=Amycolatopsis thermoflava TaxID=84480 RepID=UPI0004237D17|nr:hypothetical protein [Amycolatopsis thermoflava]